MSTLKTTAILTLALGFAPLALAQEASACTAEQVVAAETASITILDITPVQDDGPVDLDKEKKGKKDGERKKKDGERKKKDGDGKKKKDIDGK